MLLYLDSSAIVKLYLEEARSDEARAAVAVAELVTASRVALVEVCAALTRRARRGDLDDQQLRQVVAALRRDWATMIVIELDERAASDIAMKHALRGFDAVHLAAALETAARSAAEGAAHAFLAYDDELSAAARAEGLVAPQV